VSGADADDLLRLPLQGALAPQSEDVVSGEKLALERGNKAATSRSSTSRSTTRRCGRQVGAGQTSANARKVAQDDSASPTLGEFNSGASAISIPILNEAGILQVSPVEHAVGLTSVRGRRPGEPDKYYPSASARTGASCRRPHPGRRAVPYMKDRACTKSTS
jgi:branched-chain amino acid transport system substrate-binding protein